MKSATYCMLWKQFMPLIFIAALLACLIFPACTAHPEPSAATLLIRNARIIDGTGNPWYRGSIAVEGGRITAVGPNLDQPAGRVIDAEDKVISPGFIDLHNHCDTGLFENPDAQNFLRQGVTTLVGGPDGEGAADMGACLARLDSLKLALNVCFTVGHNAVRTKVMGLADRAPTPEELEAMKSLVARAMQAGAVGLSTGLEYVPGVYSTTEEVIELARVSAAYGGFYTSHIRDEELGLLSAVREVIRIAREAGTPANITHFKAFGWKMWGKSVEALQLVEQARAEELDVTCDLYPYSAAHTGLEILFPPWSLAGGRDSLLARLQDSEQRRKIEAELLLKLGDYCYQDDPAQIAVARCAFDTELEGKSLRSILEERGLPTGLPQTVKLVIELQQKGGADCIYHCMSDEDVERIMRHPVSMIASDGEVIKFGTGVPHPRSYGTFPRVLAEYVRNRPVLTLEEAVRKMTSLPARRAGLAGRGLIYPGAEADLLLFDPETVADRSTFGDPHQYPAGIETVIVNGEVVFENGGLTGAHPGRVLRKEITTK